MDCPDDQAIQNDYWDMGYYKGFSGWHYNANEAWVECLDCTDDTYFGAFRDGYECGENDRKESKDTQ